MERRITRPFVLSYFDNIYDYNILNDIPYTEKMQIDIYKMLLFILNEYDYVNVYLKPKRRWTHEVVAKMFPEIQKFIDCNRIKIFFGDTERTKAVPAEIAMISDLVIGLGISTAAAEAAFAGCLAFHANLTPFLDNEFVRKGLGKIVFNDMASLKEAVIEVIENNNMQIFVLEVNNEIKS